MARSHGKGDQWDNPRDGVGRAGRPVKMRGAAAGSRSHVTGQQSGGKRPATKTGAAKRAPDPLVPEELWPELDAEVQQSGSIRTSASSPWNKTLATSL